MADQDDILDDLDKVLGDEATAGEDAPEGAPDEVDPERVKAALRELPQVEQVVQGLAGVEGVGDRSRQAVTAQVRLAVEATRHRILAGELGPDEVAPWFGSDTFHEEMRGRLARPPYHARVLNATGVVLHTGLGRAPLCLEAREAVQEAAGYCRLEIDPDSGERSRREDPVNALLVDLTGAEAALVVNNNAAATLLALNTLATGLEVTVSRAEMVEIGGSYRMPEVMRYAGCRLVDVGCTNRTYIRDYRAAVTENTGLLLKVHTSNYRIRGFTEHPGIAALVELGRELDIPVMDDLGSGQIWDDPIPGLEDEPRVRASVAAGATLVCFSGDKLLGGTQAGILVGRKDAVEACRRNPLYRAVRCDKLALAALEATLEVYASQERVEQRLPTLRYLLAPIEELKRNARRLKAAIDRRHLDGLGSFLVDGASRAGSGSAPDRDLPTRLVALKPAGSAEEFVRRLRRAPVPLFARVHEDTVLLDPRTLEDEEFSLVADAVAWAAEG